MLQLLETLRDDQQRRRQVAAVDGGDVARKERRQRRGVVPVQEMSLMALERLDGAQRRLEAEEQPFRGQVPQIVRRHRREERHPDVGRRGAMRDATGLAALALLEVVGRQPAIGLGDEGLEVAPGRAGGQPQPRLLVVAQVPDARADRQAEPVGHDRSADPQQRNGDATGSASRRQTTSASATTPATIGLEIISTKNRRRPRLPTRPDARAAVLAAVSHSSSRRLVTTSRVSVTVIACTASTA
jgi:hypothetical protein